MTNEGYFIKKVDAWWRGHRLAQYFANGLFSRFKTITGRMNQEGVVHPCNEPVLIKSETIHISEAASTALRTRLDLLEWFGCPADELKNYFVDIWIQVDLRSDAVISDNIAFGLQSAVPADVFKVTIADPWELEDGDGKVQPFPFRLFPYSDVYGLAVGFSSWGATETHQAYLTVHGYRIADNIAYES